MLEVTLLGQFEVLHDGVRLTIPSRNAQALFAYLLLNAGQTHRRERLAGLLWPDSSEENARSNLRHELWRLRKALEKTGGSYFLVDNLTIAIDPESGYSLDVHSLERTALEGSTADELTAALSVYQGELLPGFYHEWVFVERERLQSLFEARIARLLEILLGEGRWAEVQEWASRWIAFGGWPEPAYRALMTANASTGDVSRAMVTYERFAHGLYQDLGLKPSEQTQALFERLQAGWKTDVQAQAPALRSQPPEAMASPLARLRRSNLPRPLTSFIGREVEMRQVEGLLSGARLVTITGSGGVGKTRLAIQVARSLVPQFEDGVCWVELASLFAASPSEEQDPSDNGRLSRERAAAIQAVGFTRLPGEDLVIQAVAKALRVPESPGLPLLDELMEYLHGRQLLLVLDNCEHLIAACAALVEGLLGDCPPLTVLATSREPLGVPGEKTWQLPSLSLPEMGPTVEFSRIAQSEAVRLFVERTADVLPGYKLVELETPAIAQICLRLDGIPLAIELAAARMNLLSAGEIAARLDDRFSLLTAGRRTALPRHQTLRAAIEWSTDLLGEAEKVLFCRLSVFAGSFTLEAAEAVCAGVAIERNETLTLIGRLVDKSLLQVDPAPQHTELATRYRFLDTIRSFGRLKLAEAGETRSMRDRHAAYYVHLVESAGPSLLLQNQTLWYKLLDAERGNIRAAIEWGVESGQAESSLRLVGAMLWFWWWQGYVSEGLDFVLEALALPLASQYKQYRARALNTAGYLQWALRDVGASRQNIEEALSIFRELGDETGLAWSLPVLGLVLTSEGQYDLADRAMQDGIAIALKLGDLNKSSISLLFLGDVALQQGDRAKAKRVYEECADLLRGLGNKFEAYPLRRLGYLALERNDVAQTWHYFRKSLRLNRETGDKRAVAACLTGLAALALRLDKPLLATRLLGAVEKQLESLTIHLLDLDRVELERVRSETLATLDEADFAAAFAGGWELSEEEAVNLVEETFGGESGQVLGQFK